MMRSDSRGGVKPGSTFADMRAKARAGSLVKECCKPGDCATAGMTPNVRNAGQGSGIVQKSPIQTSRTGHDPTAPQAGSRGPRMAP